MTDFCSRHRPRPLCPACVEENARTLEHCQYELREARLLLDEAKTQLTEQAKKIHALEHSREDVRDVVKRFVVVACRVYSGKPETWGDPELVDLANQMLWMTKRWQEES